VLLGVRCVARVGLLCAYLYKGWHKGRYIKGRAVAWRWCGWCCGICWCIDIDIVMLMVRCMATCGSVMRGCIMAAV
jgi:hypothetical protein